MKEQKTMFTIIDFDPFTAGDPTWEAYFNFCKITSGVSFDITDFRIWTLDVLKRKNIKYKFIYRGGDLVICIQAFSKKDTAGDEMHFMACDTAITDISSAVTKIIADAILQLATEHQIESFRIATANHLTKEIMAAFGGKVINTINFYQFSKKDINWNLIQQWRSNYQPDSKNFTTEFHEYVPENLYGEYAALMTELMNDIKREDNNERFEETAEGAAKRMELFKTSGVQVLTLMLFNFEHELCGISLMMLHPGSGTSKQQMTGVKRQHRGRKLGGYLKASITEETFSRFPGIEKIETDCYSVNEPIIYLNLALGFSLVEQSLQFSVDTVKIERFIALQR